MKGDEGKGSGRRGEVQREENTVTIRRQPQSQSKHNQITITNS